MYVTKYTNLDASHLLTKEYKICRLHLLLLFQTTTKTFNHSYYMQNLSIKCFVLLHKVEIRYSSHLISTGNLEAFHEYLCYYGDKAMILLLGTGSI